MLDAPINALVHEMQDLQKAGAGITRIQELLGTHSRINDEVSTGDVLMPDSGALAVVFQNVTFGYDDNLGKNGKNGSAKPGSNGKAAAPAGEEPPKQPKEIVLKDISFCLEPGKILGLLGRTGSGKTTLTRLLFRFYDPDQGYIQIGVTESDDDLVDLRRLPRSFLRRQVGIVTQNIQLFNASVRDNLTFFDHSIPDVKMLEMVEALGLQDWFRKLPEGLDTVLEANGSGLSAGEAQLLAFAHLPAQSGLVIDEASRAGSSY
jgi:ABC-type multidrug transport system fused ATPase/permease subunit